MDVSTHEFWTSIKASLKAKNSENKLLQTWFEPTELVGTDDNNTSGRKFRLGVPTELHKYWISENLLDRICTEIGTVYTGPFEIDLTVTCQTPLVEPENPGALKQAMNLNDKPEAPKPVAAPTHDGAKRDFIDSE